MSQTYKAYWRTPAFKKSFDKLTEDQQKKAKKAFRIFKKNPFDPSLKSHKIHKLSSRNNQTVYGLHIEGDLIVVFITKDDQVISLDIGTHDIYKDKS